MSLALATCGYLTDETVGAAPIPPPAPGGSANVDPPPPAPNGTANITPPVGNARQVP